MWTSHCPAHRIRALPDESVCYDTGIPDKFFSFLSRSRSQCNHDKADPISAFLYHRSRTDPDGSGGSIYFQASYRPDTPKEASGSYPRWYIRSPSGPVFRMACIIFL